MLWHIIRTAPTAGHEQLTGFGSTGGGSAINSHVKARVMSRNALEQFSRASLFWGHASLLWCMAISYSCLAAVAKPGRQDRALAASGRLVNKPPIASEAENLPFMKIH